jgi:intracellular septation protein A
MLGHLTARSTCRSGVFGSVGDVVATVQAHADSGLSPPAGTPADPRTGTTMVALPGLKSLARQAIPRLLEAVIIPLALFYTALAAFGLNGALAAALAWAYGILAWRRLRGHPLSASVILATIAITVRVALAAWSGSAIIYFLQPELGTICFSMLFLASVRLRRPMVGKLINEYVQLPQAVLAHARIRRCFAQLTVLWALILLLNSTLSIWLHSCRARSSSWRTCSAPCMSSAC